MYYSVIYNCLKEEKSHVEKCLKEVHLLTVMASQQCGAVRGSGVGFFNFTLWPSKLFALVLM